MHDLGLGVKGNCWIAPKSRFVREIDPVNLQYLRHFGARKIGQKIGDNATQLSQKAPVRQLQRRGIFLTRQRLRASQTRPLPQRTYSPA
jgi:hypothetical protein